MQIFLKHQGVALATWLVLIPFSSLAGEGEWPQWRGPSHDGISAEKGWTVQWPKEGPKQLWKVSVGLAYSSMAVQGGRVFTMGNVGGTDTVWCLEAATGKEIWKHSYACPSPPNVGGYPGPRATPTVEGGRVYTFSRKGHLFCLDAAKGTVVWQKDVKQESGSKPPQWDFSGSVLVYDKLLVLNVGSAGLAFDKATGNVAWKSGPAPAGYATPVPFDSNGQKGIAIFTANGLNAVNPADGKALWDFPWDTNYKVNSADPIFFGDKVFFSSGYDRGCAAISFGKAAPAKLWENKELCNHTSSSVGWNGHVYGFNGQISSAGALKCLDLQTGTAKWTQPNMMGSLQIADGKLVLLTTKGKLVVAEASPQAYKELASAQVLGGECWTAPVLAGGKVFCRNTEGDLVCLNVSGK